MKRIFSITAFLVTVIALTVIPAFSQDVNFESSQDGRYMAKDSSLANSNTKASGVLTLHQKTARASTAVNYLNGAAIIVTAKQANDSVSAVVSLRVGRVTGGTNGSTFGTFALDTLSATKKTILISLSNYAVFPEVSVVVTGLSAGNGVGATWTALFGGAGKIVQSVRSP